MEWDEITGEKKKFFCKAVLNKNQVSLLGRDWAFSKRCQLEIKEDKFIVAGQEILLEAIKSATLRIYRSAFFIQGCVLTIKGEGFIHNFGLNYSDYWKSDLPFPVQRSYEKPPYLLIRQGIVVILILYSTYKIIQWLL
ncbi:hypothetical protein QUF76_19320 [Desulfobacterales bacterium HSG16]|nr:hypothetical protein [Desulfobacterales bacterium HSG16]